LSKVAILNTSWPVSGTDCLTLLAQLKRSLSLSPSPCLAAFTGRATEDRKLPNVFEVWGDLHR